MRRESHCNATAEGLARLVREVGESTHHTHEVIDEAAEWCMCVLDDRFAFGPVQL